MIEALNPFDDGNENVETRARGVKVSQRGVEVSQRVPTEAAGRMNRLRENSISPGLRIHYPGPQIQAHTACRVPFPLSPISGR